MVQQKSRNIILIYLKNPSFDDIIINGNKKIQRRKEKGQLYCTAYLLYLYSERTFFTVVKENKIYILYFFLFPKKKTIFYK